MWDLIFAVGMPVGVFLICALLWWLDGRDPKNTDAIFPHYTPPSDLSVIEAGVLMDDLLQTRDIAYELYDLFFEGLISFEENDYVTLLKPLKSKEVKSLPDTQRAVLGILFPGVSTSMRLSSYNTQFKSKQLKNEIYDELVTKGFYYSSPHLQRKTYYFLGYAMIIGGIGFNIFSFFFFLRAHGDSITSAPYYIPLSLVVGLALSGIACGIFGAIMASKSEKGVKKLKELLGFKEFVMTAEKDRIELFLKEEPEAYKKILPYAFLFGVKEKWLAPAKNLQESFLDEDVLKLTLNMDMDAFEEVFEEKRNIVVSLLNIIFYAVIQAVKFGLLGIFEPRKKFPTTDDSFNDMTEITEKEEAYLQHLREDGYGDIQKKEVSR